MLWIVLALGLMLPGFAAWFMSRRTPALVPVRARRPESRRRDSRPRANP